jgi:hypothetical protein
MKKRNIKEEEKWKAHKLIITAKFNYKCVYCNKPAMGSQIHHLIHRKDGGTDDLENLVLLCGRCHMLESNTPDFAVYNAFRVPYSEIPKLRYEIRKFLENLKFPGQIKIDFK